MKYTRADISENIGCSMIIDEKFKTGTLTIRFITDLDGSTAAANSLGVSVLSSSNKKYRSIAALNEKLSMLYGASISSFARKRGDVQILAVAASWLDSRYAIDGEDIDSEMLAIVRDCIFAPNAENGEFDSEAFAITKKDLIDRIDAELNNKRGYAISRASEVAFEGEPAQFSCYGTKESAEAVTSAQAYTAYRKLIENAHVEICYISPRENPGLVKMFRECFGTTERRSVKFRSISPVKNDVRRVSDTYDVQQCKMVLTFKSDSEDMYAMKMLSTIYGETPVSKLFMNVREKLSLCYYCACRTVGSKGAIMVDSGVERKKSRTCRGGNTASA